ncbi:hypothetical protein [Streptomyces sp. NBC_01445]|uniref:hypothetical protein n=1 Tax=Streptomyces sp. NBC_01445 TaxID=2903869 RepID=UPI002DDBD751|nr:hypothetical protein [Streptomyces sp. NBC_01445]WSE02053.1 hypothetical protein OG574_00570 [Streptomyces sp. NBC_01445]WSE10277.1 hypothetical protein OG574_47440 [Streptomyces sp. NBC_01445]WSE11154.1 hypothetical protein OG574_48580 [Streptomyces sp. NBC_01445]
MTTRPPSQQDAEVQCKFDSFALQDSANPRASVWDLLAHPELGDVCSRPYTERRALLLDLLHDVLPPIQAVPATDDPDVAQLWYDTLQA